MQLRDKGRSVATFAWDKQLGDPFVDTIDISVPLMVNSKPLGKGEELVVFWKSKGLKQVTKVVVTTWLDQAVKLAKKSRAPSEQVVACNVIRFCWAYCMMGLPFCVCPWPPSRTCNSWDADCVVKTIRSLHRFGH